MKVWRALGISVVGYYVLALAQLVIAAALNLDILAPSLPLLFWVAATLVTIALAFGLMQWYFRAHDQYGLLQGLGFGLVFLLVGILLDVLYVYVPGEPSTVQYLFASYTQSPGFLIQALAIIATAAFVGQAHQRHRGEKKRKR